MLAYESCSVCKLQCLRPAVWQLIMTACIGWQAMIDKSWRSECIGQGKDGRGMTHKKAKVLKVWSLCACLLCIRAYCFV